MADFNFAHDTGTFYESNFGGGVRWRLNIADRTGSNATNAKIGVVVTYLNEVIDGGYDVITKDSTNYYVVPTGATVPTVNYGIMNIVGSNTSASILYTDTVIVTVPTPDIATPAGITSDLMRTDALGAKKMLAYAMNFTINNSATGVTVGDQTVNFAIAAALTEQEVTDIITGMIGDFLTSSDVTSMLADYATTADVSGLSSVYKTISSFNTDIASRLQASDLDTLTVDIATTGSVSADIVNVATKIVFADGSTLEQYTLA